MANTTFSGPVRSENGFESITKNETTGAVDLTNLVTELTTGAGAAAVTLANGTTSGQIKIITMVVDGGGTATVTPVTFASGTTLAFDAVAETATLVWNSSIGWILSADRGVTIA